MTWILLGAAVLVTVVIVAGIYGMGLEDYHK